VSLQRSSFYHRPIIKDEGIIISRMKTLVEEHRSWGYPKVHAVLRREGLIKNPKRTYRIYRQEGLSLRIRKRHKRAASLRMPLTEAQRPNSVGRWILCKMLFGQEERSSY
jgi:putative transposase